MSGALFEAGAYTACAAVVAASRLFVRGRAAHAAGAAAIFAIAALVALSPGRTPLWTYSVTPAAFAVFGVMMLAAACGLRGGTRSWRDAVLFAGLFTGATIDARLAPIFVIVIAPMLAVSRAA